MQRFHTHSQLFCAPNMSNVIAQRQKQLEQRVEQALKQFPHTVDQQVQPAKSKQEALSLLQNTKVNSLFFLKITSS